MIISKKTSEIGSSQMQINEMVVDERCRVFTTSWGVGNYSI